VLYSETVASGSVTNTEYFAYNAVGSVVALLNGSGVVTDTTDYEAFGKEVRTTGSTTENRKFCTKERDTSIGLDNFGFRYFDWELGRFTTRDPSGYPDGPNNYLYCHNNPINFVDPLGLEENDGKKTKAMSVSKFFEDMFDFKGNAKKSVANTVKPFAGGLHRVAGIQDKINKETGGALDTLDAWEYEAKVLATSTPTPLEIDNLLIYGGTLPYYLLRRSRNVAGALDKFSDLLRKTDKVTDAIDDAADSGKFLNKADDALKVNRLKNIKSQGFQDHHILSNKNPLTRDHELVDMAGGVELLEKRSNKILLPDDAANHATRSIHKGRHYNKVSENNAKLMDSKLEKIRQSGGGQEEALEAINQIQKKQREALKAGDVKLNKNSRDWAE
jgi:RHS repeat-associated protein